MKKHFVKNIMIYLLIIVLLLITFCLLGLNTFEHYKAQIETLNINFDKLATADSLFVEEIKQTQFREKIYLEQLNRDTNLVLLVFGLLTALYGIGSYFSIQKRVEIAENQFELDVGELKNKFIEKTDELDSKFISFKEEQVVNTRDIHLLHSRSFELIAEGLLTKNLLNEYFEAILFSINYMCHSVVYSPSTENKFKGLVIKNVEIHLNDLLTRSKKSNQKLNVKEHYINSTYDYIHKINNQDLLNLFFKLKNEVSLL